MKACQLFQKISPALGQEIISYLREEQKEVYRATLVTLAGQRKLRPQFVQKKSRDQQAAWILETLKMRSSEGVGEQLLQVWLMKAESPMLVTFLDHLGVPHDGQGAIEQDLPSSFEAARVTAGVAGLLEKFPAEKVAVYLHIFQLQQPGGWPEIASELQARPELSLGAEPDGAAAA